MKHWFELTLYHLLFQGFVLQALCSFVLQ